MLSFVPLSQHHFPALLRWLMTPHVRTWWDQQVDWTIEKIAAKYTAYVEGYKILGTIKKPMHAFVIQVDQTLIGYIQYYNKHDFPPEQGYSIDDLPKPLAALDFYIGEAEYLGKGLGSQLLISFLQDHGFFHFPACFVDPEADNSHAIRVYEQAGFQKMKEIPEKTLIWMVAHRDHY